MVTLLQPHRPHHERRKLGRLARKLRKFIDVRHSEGRTSAGRRQPNPWPMCIIEMLFGCAQRHISINVALRAARGIRWVTIAAMLVGGCRPAAQNDGPPPRATDRIRIEPQSSTISVPMRVDLRELSSALEREIPKTLWTIDKPGQVCVASKKVKVVFVKLKTPTIKCRIVGRVTRGALSIGGSGQNIVVTMPIRAVVSANDIGGILKRETAAGDARVRAIAQVDVAQDWSLRGKVNIVYDWTEEPTIDFLGQKIELTSQADEKLKGVVARLERTLPRELAKLQLRDNVERVWAQGFTSLQLNRTNPPVWMRITPQSLQFGDYSVGGGALLVRLGMKATTETFVGKRPVDPSPVPLPRLSPLTSDPGKFMLYIPVIADYAQLEPVVQRALVKRSARPFEVPAVGPVDARFGKVTVYGTTGGRIAVGVNFTATDRANRIGKSSGTVWLTGLPVNPPGTRKVGFADIQVRGVTDRTGTNLLLRLANTSSMAQTIGEALGQNFKNDYAELMGKISRAIDEKREGRLLIRARIEDVRSGSLKATGEGLYLPVWGTGVASVELR